MSSNPNGQAATTLTPGAQRVRDSRARRREGFRVVPLELHDREVTALIETGWLAEADCSNRVAVAAAMGAMLDHMSGHGESFPARPR